MIPDGDLLRARVVTDLAPVFEDAFDRRLDGYAVLSPRETLLGTADDRGVLTFEDGIPTLAYHVGTDRGGPPALGDIGAGPHRIELYTLDAATLEVPHGVDELRVPPGMPAERLAGDPELADRTRSRATDGNDPSRVDDRSALEAFLENETAVQRLQESARQEARRRAEEWGLETAIHDES